MQLAKYKSFAIGIAVLFGAFAIVWAMGALKPKPEEEETSKPPLTVSTAEAMLREQVVYSTFQGEVRAQTDIELVAQVTGKVMSISDKFIEGGEFAPQEVLLQIDDSDYQVALKSAEANVAAAKVDVDVELATAATNIKEWQDLQGKPIDEANPLRLNKPQIDRAKARLDAANAELAAAKLNYQRTKISAPFAGRIMKPSAELGQFISRGSSIGRVFATNAMEVRIPMTDVQINELGLVIGYSAKSSGSNGLPAVVSAVFGDQKRVWNGFVKSVDASIDNDSRLLFATVVVERPFEQNGAASMPLVPGLFVDVELASPEKLVGLELPRSALRNGNQVYSYDDGKLRLKPVKVIYTSSDKVIVAQGGEEGLNQNEAVIVSSVPGAFDGMAVSLPEPESVADAEITPQTEVSAQSDAQTDPSVDDELLIPESQNSSVDTDEKVEDSDDDDVVPQTSAEEVELGTSQS